MRVLICGRVVRTMPSDDVAGACVVKIRVGQRYSRWAGKPRGLLSPVYPSTAAVRADGRPMSGFRWVTVPESKRPPQGAMVFVAGEVFGWPNVDEALVREAIAREILVGEFEIL